MIEDKSNPIVAIESLRVRYGRTEAVKDVTLAVEPGQVYALLGRNGAGKSSLMRCLLGHQKAAAGRTLLFGEDSWKHRARLMARVGVVPEEPDAPVALTARQLSRFCAALYPRWDDAGLFRRLQRFDVPVDRPFGSLSKGQKGQVMLALALASSPEVLVLDDPTLGLDVVARKSIFEEVVEDLADRAVTVFLTTHDLAGVEGIASRVGLLQNGSLVLDEDLETLKARFRRIAWQGAERPDALASMEPLGLRRNGRQWLADAASFSDERFAALRGAADVERAEAAPLSLEEIVVALTETSKSRSEEEVA